VLKREIYYLVDILNLRYSPEEVFSEFLDPEVVWHSLHQDQRRLLQQRDRRSHDDDHDHDREARVHILSENNSFDNFDLMIIAENLTPKLTPYFSLTLSKLLLCSDSTADAPNLNKSYLTGPALNFNLMRRLSLSQKT
jgi:hypothetical protein